MKKSTTLDAHIELCDLIENLSFGILQQLIISIDQKYEFFQICHQLKSLQ